MRRRWATARLYVLQVFESMMTNAKEEESERKDADEEDGQGDEERRRGVGGDALIWMRAMRARTGDLRRGGGEQDESERGSSRAEHNRVGLLAHRSERSVGKSRNTCTSTGTLSLEGTATESRSAEACTRSKGDLET